MTPTNKIKLKNEAQTREAVAFFAQSDERAPLLESTHYCEGYAATYERYPLYTAEDGKVVYEQFLRSAFDEADMSDAIMQYDHRGMVFARTSNGSLIVRADENGLLAAADLSLTDAARQMHDAIDKRLVTKMSWRFMPGEYYYDKETRTIIHTKVKKVFDVSAVSFPANEGTEINARAWCDGVIDLAARSEAELEYRRRRLANKIKIMEAMKK